MTGVKNIYTVKKVHTLTMSMMTNMAACHNVAWQQVYMNLN